MIIIPEGMFDDVTDPEESIFKLSANQERDISLVLAPRAGWYNHYGQVLSHGDLALEDFKNISRALKNLEEVHQTTSAPFFVIPYSSGSVFPYRTLSQHDLAQQCSFVITSCDIISFDSLTPILMDIFHNNGIKAIAGHRKNITEVLGNYLIH